MANGALTPSVHAVADYILGKLVPEAGDSITNLKLQKLVYYVQGWHLAILGRPAFAEQIEAWARGPVVYDLWSRFRGYQWGIITPRAPLRTAPLRDLPDDTRELIDEVWEKYGDFQGHELEEMTHAEAPWIMARGSTPPGARSNSEITQRSMQEYFESLLEAA